MVWASAHHCTEGSAYLGFNSHAETFLDLCVCFLREFLKCRDRFMFSKFNTYVYKGGPVGPKILFPHLLLKRIKESPSFFFFFFFFFNCLNIRTAYFGEKLLKSAAPFSDHWHKLSLLRNLTKIVLAPF